MDRFLLRKDQICCHQHKSVLLVATLADEDERNGKRFVPLADGSFCRQQILRAPSILPVPPVDFLHILHHAFMEIVVFFVFFAIETISQLSAWMDKREERK